jgi:hypothetical protein
MVFIQRTNGDVTMTLTLKELNQISIDLQSEIDAQKGSQETLEIIEAIKKFWYDDAVSKV